MTRYSDSPQIATEDNQNDPKLVFGIDSLYLTGYLEFAADVLIELQALKIKALGVNNFRDAVSQILAQNTAENPMDWEQVRSEALTLVGAEDIPQEQVYTLFMRDDVHEFAFVPYSPRKMYQVQLVHDNYTLHVRLKNSTTSAPNVYIELRSGYLASAGLDQIAEELDLILGGMGDQVREPKVSRCDIAFDTDGFSENLSPDQFVSRSKDSWIALADEMKLDLKADPQNANKVIQQARESFEELIKSYQIALASGDLNQLDEITPESFEWYSNRTMQGFSFGKRGGRSPFARLYRKDRQITKLTDKQRAHVLPKWEEMGWMKDGSPIGPIWRIEFELHREFFASTHFDDKRIDSLKDLKEYLPSLVKYLVGTDSRSGWLRHVKKTRTRMHNNPLSEMWERIQAHEIHGDNMATVTREVQQQKKAELYTQRAITALVQLLALEKKKGISVESVMVGLQDPAIVEELATAIQSLSTGDIKLHIHTAFKRHELGLPIKKGRSLESKIAYHLAQVA